MSSHQQSNTNMSTTECYNDKFDYSRDDAASFINSLDGTLEQQEVMLRDEIKRVAQIQKLKDANAPSDCTSIDDLQSYLYALCLP